MPGLGFSRCGLIDRFIEDDLPKNGIAIGIYRGLVLLLFKPAVYQAV